MKILIFGFLAFISWSAFSSYIYVCKIRGYCSDVSTTQTVGFDKNTTVSVDADANLSNMEVAVNPGKLILYFDFDRSGLKSVPEADRYFEKSVNYLDQNTNARFNIIGYADATGSVKYNQALGMRRAISLQNYFISKGIQAASIRIESRGENDPAFDNSTETGRSKNRRTELTINK